MPEIPKAAVIVRHSFVKSSTQVRHLIRRPLVSASMTKSIDHVRFCILAKKRKPLSPQTFTTSSAFYTQTVKVINAVYPLVVDVKALPTQ
jgi:uncharacterized PurR-regulated membrane protein YhhQ (DUF165 family)